jgi:hypothetical protein
MIERIISGGQTGADRAGLDAAMLEGVEYGGWLPKGRMSEDGAVPRRYKHMKEMTTAKYPPRTRKNVLDSDGTVIFTHGSLKASRGSRLTMRIATVEKKQRLWINLKMTTLDEAVDDVYRWLVAGRVKVLNVAGSRESKATGIHDDVLEIIQRVIRRFEP